MGSTGSPGREIEWSHQRGCASATDMTFWFHCSGRFSGFQVFVELVSPGRIVERRYLHQHQYLRQFKLV